ncbi:hypothetical protein [Streptomyces sp. MS191]|uniref:hypothetical protein n=1 Tax=Streptomyces sp. ms191 TaxID=1827978 RepID=UPI0011CEA62C|nr:hypothetical protein [Streptomyces sp. ms191]
MTDRGKLGSKIHLITDRNGLPVEVSHGQSSQTGLYVRRDPRKVLEAFFCGGPDVGSTCLMARAAAR